jgi:hypothetical protein
MTKNVKKIPYGLLMVGLGVFGCMHYAHASYDNDAKWQIALCWSTPVDALPVTISFDTTQNGTIKNVEVVDKDRMDKDPLFKTSAEAVLRAVNNPKCAILEMPEDKYDDWKHLTVTFDPKDTL